MAVHKLIAIVALLSVITLAKGEPSLAISRAVGNTETLVVASSITVHAGENVTLSCEVIDPDRELYVDHEVVWSKKPTNSWFHSKNDLKDSLLNQVNKDAAEPSKLSFSPIRVRDHGKYICTSASHDISKSVYIIVKPPIRRAFSTSSKLERDGNDVLQSNNIDDGKLLTELLNSLNQASDVSTSAPFLYSNLHNIDWNNINSMKSDNWPSNLHWNLPDNTWDPLNISVVPFDGKLSDLESDITIPSNTFEYKSNFRHSYYAVPVSITLVLIGIVRFCYMLGKKTDRGWESLRSRTSTCAHRICAHRRIRDPSAGCMMETRGAGRLSVLIIHRITSIAGANERDNNDADDAPPSYDDSTRNLIGSENGDDSSDANCTNDLPPSYNEVLANMSLNASTNLRDAAESPPAPCDVLPTPHSVGLPQSV